MSSTKSQKQLTILDEYRTAIRDLENLAQSCKSANIINSLKFAINILNQSGRRRAIELGCNGEVVE